MPKLSKKFLQENELYIKEGIRKRVSYNRKCRQCENDCKQGCQVKVVRCPYYKQKVK